MIDRLGIRASGSQSLEDICCMEDSWWQFLSLGSCGVSRENDGLELWRVPKFRLWKITETLRTGPRLYSLSPLGEGGPGWGRVRLEKVLRLYGLLPSHPDSHDTCVSQQS